MKIVWIESEKCWGTIKSIMYGHVCVLYSKDGFEVEEWFEDDDLVDVKEMGIDYESEEYL